MMLQTGKPSRCEGQRPRPLSIARQDLVVECRPRQLAVRWGSPDPWVREPWRIAVTRHGTPLEQRSDWEQVCRLRDGNIDHWEFEARLSHGVRLQRQITHVVRDGVLFLAEAVLSPRRAAWVVETTIGVHPSVSLTEEAPPEGTPPSGARTADRRVAYVLPLFQLAAQDMPPAPAKVATCRAAGETPTVGADLTVWRGRAEGRALFLPLIFVAARTPADGQPAPFWRKLTITERGRIAPDETAVAYRVQLGPRQWVFYRSLAAPENRAFLGCNFAGESLVGAFGKKGVTSLLEVHLEE